MGVRGDAGFSFCTCGCGVSVRHIRVQEVDGHTGVKVRREACLRDERGLCVISKWVITEAWRLLEFMQRKCTE